MGYIVYKQSVVQGGLDIENGQIQYMPTPQMAAIGEAGRQVDGLRRLLDSMRRPKQSDKELYDSLPERLTGFVYVVEHEAGSDLSDDKSSKGGPGSGNHGHAGRPGLVGGSAPDKESMAEDIHANVLHRILNKPFDEDAHRDGYYFTQQEQSDMKHQVVRGLYIEMNRRAGVEGLEDTPEDQEEYRDFYWAIKDASDLKKARDGDWFPVVSSSEFKPYKQEGRSLKEVLELHREDWIVKQEGYVEERLKKWPSLMEIAKLQQSSDYIPYDHVDQAVRQWAESSNDSDLRSFSIQQEVGSMFGVELSPFQQSRIDVLEKRRAETKDTQIPYDERDRLTRLFEVDGVDEKVASKRRQLFVQSMYGRTQKSLDALPEKTLRVYRGYSTNEENSSILQEGAEVIAVHNPAESWSLSRNIAESFARGNSNRGVVLAMDVAKSRVLSTPVTGIGASREVEVVLMNIPDAEDIARVVFVAPAGSDTAFSWEDE